LPERLREKERDVDVVAAYKTTFVGDPAYPDHVARADVITFTSASTVRGFAAALGDRMQTAVIGKTIACIGPITAAAARDAGLSVDHVASEYTVDGLIAALEPHEVAP
jgi:uroporphyrinogen III methyltransferase/synthase